MKDNKTEEFYEAVMDTIHFFWNNKTINQHVYEELKAAINNDKKAIDEKFN